jgi:hypothetical protein
MGVLFKAKNELDVAFKLFLEANSISQDRCRICLRDLLSKILHLKI